MQIAKRVEARRRIESVEQIAQRRAVAAQMPLGIRDPVVCRLCEVFTDGGVHKGRTILKYMEIFDAVGPDEDFIAALATRDHLKGNNAKRIEYNILKLMTKAWEDIGLDLKAAIVSNEDRIVSTRRQRFDHLKAIGVEHNLPRSHSTFDECRTKARHVFGGAQVVRASENTETVRSGEISSAVTGPGVFPIGDGGAAIEHQDSTLTEDFVAQSSAGLRTTKSSADKSQKPIGRPKKRGKFS